MPGESGRSSALSIPVTAGATLTVFATHLSASQVIAPGRRSVSESSPSIRTMVDSTPNRHSPPSIMKSTLPSRSRDACSAFVGDGLPDILALGAAIGTPARRMSEFATGCDGHLTATESSPPVTHDGIVSFFFIMTVSGPGIKLEASL